MSSQIRRWRPGYGGIAGPDSSPAQFSAVTPMTVPANHPGSITLTLVGIGTAWDGSTVFDLSGLSGVSKVSQSVSDGTDATLVITTSAATGTLTISDNQGTVPATISVAVPLLAVNPGAVVKGTVTTITASGTNTVWTQETASTLFTVSGGTAASIGSIVVTSDTAATFSLTAGSSAAVLTIDDASVTGSGAATEVVMGQTLSIAPGRIKPSATTLVSFVGWNTQWTVSHPTMAAAGPPTGAAGWHVGTITVDDDTHCHANITSGATRGVVTFTDSTTSATATMLVAPKRTQLMFYRRHR